MGITTAAMALAFMKSTGSGFGKYLAKQFLAENPDFKTLVMQAKQNAIVDFQKEFNGVEIFTDDQFDEAINFVATSASNISIEPFDIIESMSRYFIQESFLYHENDDTKVVYCTSFCKKFCVQLYSRLLSSTKYSSVINAKEVLAESHFRQKTTGTLEQVISKIDEIKEGQERIEKVISNNRNVSFSLGIHEETIRLSKDDDNEIAELFLKVEELSKQEGTSNEQLKLSKKILTKIPPTNPYLFTRAVNTLLSSYLRGDSSSWSEGLAESIKYQEHFSAYTRVLVAALLNNSKQWTEANKVITSIFRADIFTFSDKQKNSYYVVNSLIKYHLNQIQEANDLLEQCPDKNDPEYVYVSFMLSSRDSSLTLLQKATDVFSNKNSSIRLVHGAICYIIDRFIKLQKEFGNGLEAMEQLAPHLNLAFSKTKEIIEAHKKSNDEMVQDLVLNFPTLARISGHSKEAIEIVQHALAIGYKDPMFLQSSAICLLDAGLAEQAFQCMNQVPVEEMIKNETGIEVFIFLLRKMGETHRLTSILETIQGLSISEAKKWPPLVSVAMEIGGETFYKLAQEVEKKFPDEGWAVLAVAESYIQQENFDKGIIILKKSLERKDIKLLAAVRLAKLYAITLKQSKEALPFYEIAVRANAPLTEKIEYVQTHYELKNFSDVIKHVDEYDPLSKVPNLQRLKAYACYDLGMVQQAQRIILNVCMIEPDDYQSHYNNAIFSRELGMIDELTKALQNAIRIRPNDFKSHLTLSQALLSQGKFVEAVNHAKFAMMGDFNNEIAHFNFINIHRRASQALPEDTFINSAELNELHKDALNNYATRFPQSRIMRSIQIPTDDEGKPSFQFLKEMLEKKNEQEATIFNIYRDNAAPISFLKTGLEMDSYELWCALLSNNYGANLVLSRTSTQQLLADVEKIRKAEGLLLDGMGLIILQSSNLLQFLKGTNKKNLVCSETAKEFLNVKHRLQASGDGYMTVGLQDGKMVRDDVTSERISHVIQFVGGIINFINESCETITTSLKNKKDKHGPITKLLDPEYKELWNLSSTTNNTIGAWADGNMIDLARSQGREVATLQALAVYLMQDKIITPEIYSGFVGDMVIAGYQGIIFTSLESTLFILKNKDSKTEYYFSRIIKGPYFNNFDHRLRFVSDIVIGLLKNQIQPEWMARLIKEDLLNSQVEELHKVVFGVTLYALAVENGISSDLIDNLWAKLDLNDSSGERISSDECKAYVHNAITQRKQDELDALRQQLGLTKTSEES